MLCNHLVGIGYGAVGDPATGVAKEEQVGRIVVTEFISVDGGH
jgi:hypothetical protein